MHHATRLMLGTVGIGLLAAFLVLGLTGAAIFQPASASPARTGGSGLTSASSHSARAAASHPSVGGNPTTVWANATSVPAPYSTLPAWVNFTIQVAITNSVFTLNSSDTNGSVYLVNQATETTLVNIPIVIVNGSAAQSVELDSQTLGCSAANCTATLGNIAYSGIIYVAVNGAYYNNGTAANTSATYGGIPPMSTAFITVPLVVGGLGGTSVPAGNVSVTIYYTGQYVTLVTLNIYSSTGTLVYSSNFANNATTGAPQTKIWYVGVTGTYSTAVSAATPYGTFWSNSTITVVPASSTTGGTVYQNTTTWVNSTGSTAPKGYFGLSAPASGTLFLLIGLIVGILAALVAARMMMSSPPPPPAQPWSDTKTESTSSSSSSTSTTDSSDGDQHV
jgi:hypothetical protein